MRDIKTVSDLDRAFGVVDQVENEIENLKKTIWTQEVELCLLKEDNEKLSKNVAKLDQKILDIDMMIKMHDVVILVIFAVATLISVITFY